MKIYWYPQCSTCRKAVGWLDERGVAHERVHIVESPPNAEELASLWSRSGLPLKKLFNTAGQSYRKGDFKSRLGTMSDDEALGALAADGKLIKRPLLVADDTVLVGFRPDEWDRHLARGA